jgi:hypothetical protein
MSMVEDDAGEFVECWQCCGVGLVAGCFEDTCSCLGDPEDALECCAPIACDVCRGKGGWAPCTQSDGVA